jgi:hypothetical protein
VRVVLGGLDRLLSGLGRDSLALLGLLSGSGLDDSGSGLSLASAGNIGWVSSATSGDLKGWLGGNWDGCRSWCGSSWLFDDEWSLGDKDFLFRERSVRLLFLLGGGSQEGLEGIGVLQGLSVLDGDPQVLVGLALLVEGCGQESGGVRLSLLACWNSSEGDRGSSLITFRVLDVGDLGSGSPKPEPLGLAFILCHNQAQAED